MKYKDIKKLSNLIDNWYNKYRYESIRDYNASILLYLKNHSKFSKSDIVKFHKLLDEWVKHAWSTTSGYGYIFKHWND